MSAAAPAGEPLAALSALAAAGLWAAGCVLVERVLVRGPRPPSAAAANLFKNLLAGAALGAIALASGASAPPASAWPALLLSGLLGFAVGDTLYFAAFSRCGAHATAVIGNLGPPLAALLSFLVQGVRLSAGTLGCMAVVLLGILLVLSDPVRRPFGGGGTARRRALGLALAGAAALAQALAVVLGNEGFAGVAVLPGVLTRLCGGVAGGVALAALARFLGQRGELAATLRPLRERRIAAALLLPSLLAAVLTLPLHGFALRDARPAVSAVLFATTPLFTLPLTRLFGARHGARTLLGTALGFGGAAALILAG